ncbi:MAG: flagellar export chaperone FliS [Leptospiraceae bacterium]|nr:flagellar export chaperone FliS [Leptospiraceae bacterium]MCP5513224.1 flagellar export chaperone FliS [Leptospiraceae bacterium]
MSLSNRSSFGSGYNSYKSNEVSTVSQGKLIVMLYEGAIRFLNIAKEHVNNPRKYDVVNENIIKVQDIISELMGSLNLDAGGKVANDLLALYVYFKKRLLEANMNKDEKILNELIKNITELKTAWEEIEKKEPSAQATLSKSGGGLSIKG